MREQGIRTRGAGDAHFRITCQLGKHIEVSRSYWRVITVLKHPSIATKQAEVQETLQTPDEIRRSVKGNKVFLYYKKYGSRYLCVIVRHRNGTGFIITAYLTKKIKEGIMLWQKKESK